MYNMLTSYSIYVQYLRPYFYIMIEMQIIVLAWWLDHIKNSPKTGVDKSKAIQYQNKGASTVLWWDCDAADWQWQKPASNVT